MKFICTRENLVRALDIVSPLAGKQSTLPILHNVLCTATEAGAELFSTNLESAIKTGLRARTESTGSFSIPAKTLSDYVHLLSAEQVEIELTGNELQITCGSSQTKIKGSPADEFPVIPPLEEADGYALPAAVLKQALSRTAVAVARNEIRPELSGVYFNFFPEHYSGLVLAATDSYRLSETRAAVSQGKQAGSCIVPGRVVYELIRLLGVAQGGEEQVRLSITDNQIIFRYDSFELSARLIDGTYPDYTQIIPDKFKTTAKLPVAVTTNTIKAASLFTTTGVNGISFDVKADKHTVHISSTSTQTGEHAAEIDAEITGEDNTILLNHRYVLDGLNHIDTDQVEFGVNSPDSPCLFRPVGTEGYLYIVMPIRQ